MGLFRWASPSTLSCGDARGLAFVHLACQHLVFTKFLICGLCYDRAVSCFNFLFLVTERLTIMLPDRVFHLHVAFLSSCFIPLWSFLKAFFSPFHLLPEFINFFPVLDLSSLPLTAMPPAWASVLPSGHHRGITLNSLNPFKGPFCSQHLGLHIFF